MDGWETRRRRGASAAEPHPAAEDHDWALIRLGVPGVVRGLVVDTAHFRGNYPQAVSVQAACVPGAPSPGGTAGPGREVDRDRPPHRDRRARRQRLRSHRRAALHAPAAQPAPRRRRRPAARVRRGRPRPGLARRPGHLRPGRPGERRLGRGRLRPVLLAGDEHHPARPFGHRWTTAGRPGAAATRATTGSATHWPARPRCGPSRSTPATSRATRRAGPRCSAGTARTATGTNWWPAPRLQPDTVHRFLLDAEAAARPLTQVRLDIFPDGGIARLRLHGSLTEAGARALTARHEALSG